MKISKSFKSTSLAIIIALGVEISIAQTSKPVKPRSVVKTARAANVTSGAAQSFVLTTFGAEKALIVSGSQNAKCVITEGLAKKFRIPFQMLVDFVSERRFELDCTYTSANPSDQTAADTFFIRAFLE